MVAEVLQVVDTDVDVMILDRGFFDALIWLELQHRRRQVTDVEKSIFANFVLLERWRSLVDVTVVMSVDPAEALRRENQNLIVPREGSVMNSAALVEFNNALIATKETHREQFELIDFTSDSGIKSSNTGLVRQLLQQMRRWTDPRIAAVPRAAVANAFGVRQFIPMPEAKSALECLCAKAIIKVRSDLEKDKEHIQLVACGVLKSNEGYFVLRRSQRDEKSRQYGERTMWKGCHIDILHES